MCVSSVKYNLKTKLILKIFFYQVGLENWGSDSSTHALRQEANWMPYVRLRPEKEPIQEKKWTQLRQSNKVDEILNIKYGFLSMSDPKVGE